MLSPNYALLQKTFQPLARNLKMKFCALCRRRRDSTESCPYLLSASQTRSLLVGLSLLGGSPTFDGKRAQKTGSGTCTIYVESCNKVTPKNNRVTLKEQSELTKNQTHFGTLPTLPSKGVYRIQIFPPFYLAKERRAISAKERGRSCALRPSSN